MDTSTAIAPRRGLLTFLLTLLLTVSTSLGLAVGCSADRAETDGNATGTAVEAPEGCTPGTLGCTCALGDLPCASKDLTCHQGLCVEASTACPTGTEGCGCYGNATCDMGADGPLICDGTVCADAVDVLGCVGDLGCACYPNSTCNAGLESLICQGQVCKHSPGVSECPVGAVGCPCYGNLTCNDSEAGQLTCQGNVCVVGGKMPVGCTTGDVDCGCYPNGTCNTGLDGKAFECGAGNICEPPEVDPNACPTGDDGCACYPNKTCNKTDTGIELACYAGLCEVPEPVMPGQECKAGTKGCPCYGNATCNIGSNGLPMVCEGNLCQSADALPCVAGTEGCPCYGNETCNKGLVCDALTCVSINDVPASQCPVGQGGCACYPNATCDAGFVCNGTLCEASPDCPAGTEGCPCYGNGTCDFDANGVAMACESTGCVVVEVVDCPTGSLGCACWGNGTCNQPAEGPALVCQGVTCEVSTVVPCTPGTLDCACVNGACGPGLDCGPTEKCYVPSCPAGKLGCPCPDSAFCQTGQFCDVDATCQSESCTRGALGCGCTLEGTCDAGYACQQNTCVYDGTLGPLPPEEPVCYTPCSSGKTTADGVWIACDADGLMPGCLSDEVCLSGSCVSTTPLVAPDAGDAAPDSGDGTQGDETPGEVILAPPTCASDDECPFFQACLFGGCYSTCTGDSDCNPGSGCHAKVCRRACTTTGDECADGTACESNDGATGYCMPKAAATVAAPPTVDLSVFRFELSTEVVSFDSLNTVYSVAINNAGPAPVTFTISKAQHSYYGDEGLTVVETNPLGWLHLGPVGDSAKVSTMTLTVPAATGIQPGTASFEIANAADQSQPQYDGVLVVEGHLNGQSLGQRRLQLSYIGKPEGEWVGEMHFFANFRDVGLPEWVNGPDGQYGTSDDRFQQPGDELDGQNRVQLIQNAFVKRWIALKEGDISADEFDALLDQTLNGSWNWVNVRSRCPDESSPQLNQACYLYDDPNIATDSGIVTYSAALDTDPIPSGVSTLPITLNLTGDAENPSNWTGRINSAGTMHYPGDPSFSLSFLVDPNGCDNQNLSQACLAYLQGMGANIVMGGRYESATGQCPDGAGAFTLDKSPWLLTDFVPDFVSDAGEAQSCVYERLPSGPFGDLAINKSLTSAMPIPSGQPLKRKLRLIDGALVNQRRLVILFEEQYTNVFSADPMNEEVDQLSTYGVMVLRRSTKNLRTEDFIGNNQKDFVLSAGQELESKLSLSCESGALSDVAQAMPGLSPEQKQSILDGSFTSDIPLMKDVALALVGGTAAVIGSAIPYCPDGVCAAPSDNAWTAHYFCEDTGLFNGGPDPDQPVPCPHGSNVVYFATKGQLAGLGDRLQHLSCQNHSLDSLLQFADHGTDVDFKYKEPYCLNPSFDVPLPFEELAVTECAPGQSAGNEGPQSNVDLGDYISLAPGSDSARGSCAAVLEQWASGALPEGIVDLDLAPVRECYDPNATSFDLAKTFCDADRYDLLAGKVFKAAPAENPKLAGLTEAIRDAFRYKTRFVNREGTSLGFTPEVCKFGVAKGEYCYAPADIDRVRQRVDCATWLYTEHFEDLAPSGDVARAMLRSYLQNIWGKRLKNPAGETMYSFERLYADLLVAFGDEHYTNAFAGRFDLAGEANEAFEGSKFEVGGIDLTGGAGYEMASLYKAVQYYRLVLGRFYHATPYLYKALHDDDVKVLTFVTPDTVVRYMDRVVRASAQKARTWSEVAERYHAFHEPVLARRVLDRAYAAVYVEAMLVTSVMHDTIEAFSADSAYSASTAQLRLLLDNTQLQYTQALLRMRDLREDLNAGLTYFGFAPEYIPFPALPTPSPETPENGFENLLAKARVRTQIAAEKEDKALATSKSYETDQAAFEQELFNLRANYKTQLQELCGTFEGDDGNVYPAISLYADYSDATKQIQAVNGDICGYMGNGEIVQLRASATAAEIKLKRVANEQGNILERIEIERERVALKCKETLETGDFKIKVQGNVTTLETATEGARAVQNGIAQARKTMALAGSLEGSGGLSWSEALKEVVKGAVVAASATLSVISVAAEVKATINTNKIGELEAAQMGWETETPCDLVTIDGNARTREIVLELGDAELNALDAVNELSLALNQVDARYREVKSLLHDLDEVEQSIINVAVAKNDPNSRIYRNSAIVTADRTFERALKSAYQATKVFEYHTSQSYPYLGDLFLTRMVQYGPNSLEQYIDELEDAYETFEETYGQPDVRVAVLSLRDDIMGIPYSVGDGSCGSAAAPSNVCTVKNRVQMFRDRLSQAEFIDENGYITLPFKTGLKQTSPLTRNHKVYRMEVELVGSDLGDASGRIYVRQRGIGTLSTLDDAKNFYAFDERTGVIDAWFNGRKPFDADVYASWRFRERPFVNTGWELTINTVDEQVNEDINLHGLEDIRLYVYYTDFTVL